MYHRIQNDRIILTALALTLAACAALALPGAASASGSGGAVVFSRVVTTTTKTILRDAEGNPLKEADGTYRYDVSTSEEGGLFAAKRGRLNQLTEDTTDAEPSFARNGRAIVFARSGDLYTVRADGSGLHRVTGGPELDGAPRVAPNGRYVVFERRPREGAPADLYTVPVGGGRPKALAATPGDDHEASFSGDGRLVVFVRSVPRSDGSSADDLYSVRPWGAGRKRLTRTGGIDEWAPRYFAGGIVYSRGRDAGGDSGYADVYTMRRNGGRQRSQVAGAGSASVEDVSPDGHTLLFRRSQGLWVKRIGHGRARKLSELPDESRTNCGVLLERPLGGRVRPGRRDGRS